MHTNEYFNAFANDDSDHIGEGAAIILVCLAIVMFMAGVAFGWWVRG